MMKEIILGVVIGIIVLCLLLLFIGIVAGVMVEDKEPDYDTDKRAWIEWCKRQFNKF